MRSVPVLAACVLLAGCVDAEVVRARAAEAMDCPTGQIDVDKRRTPASGPHANDDVYLAKGCGHEMRFYCGDALEQTTTRESITGSDVRRERSCRPDTDP